MRSELNVTHSKKWKTEAFGDHPIAFVSRWLLRCRVVTRPGCWNRVTWLHDLPVDGREGGPSPVSVQDGALPGNVYGFRFPLRNQWVSWWRMETSFSREWVSALVKMVTHWRRAAVVLRGAFAQAPLSLTCMCGITVWTLDLVHYWFTLLFILIIYKLNDRKCEKAPFSLLSKKKSDR